MALILLKNEKVSVVNEIGMNNPHPFDPVIPLWDTSPVQHVPKTKGLQKIKFSLKLS